MGVMMGVVMVVVMRVVMGVVMGVGASLCELIESIPWFIAITVVNVQMYNLINKE